MKRTVVRSLKSRLESHFTASALAAVAGVCGAASQANAVIVYSGVLNTAIPATTAGIYLKCDTAQVGAIVTGYDLNVWLSGSTPQLWFGSSSPGTGKGVAATAGGLPIALVDGTDSIDGTRLFS